MKKVSATQDLEETYGNILSVVVLGNMNIINKKGVVNPGASLWIRNDGTAYLMMFHIFQSWITLK